MSEAGIPVTEQVQPVKPCIKCGSVDRYPRTPTQIGACRVCSKRRKGALTPADKPCKVCRAVDRSPSGRCRPCQRRYELCRRRPAEWNEVQNAKHRQKYQQRLEQQRERSRAKYQAHRYTESLRNKAKYLRDREAIRQRNKAWWAANVSPERQSEYNTSKHRRKLAAKAFAEVSNVLRSFASTEGEAKK